MLLHPIAMQLFGKFRYKLFSVLKELVTITWFYDNFGGYKLPRRLGGF